MSEDAADPSPGPSSRKNLDRDEAAVTYIDSGETTTSTGTQADDGKD